MSVCRERQAFPPSDTSLEFVCETSPAASCTPSYVGSLVFSCISRLSVRSLICGMHVYSVRWTHGVPTTYVIVKATIYTVPKILKSTDEAFLQKWILKAVGDDDDGDDFLGASEQVFGRLCQYSDPGSNGTRYLLYRYGDSFEVTMDGYRIS